MRVQAKRHSLSGALLWSGLVDEIHTETIRLVLDNLNTHKLGWYDAFKPAEARASPSAWSSTTLPYTAVLNMAESRVERI